MSSLTGLRSLSIVTRDNGLQLLARSLCTIPLPTVRHISITFIHFPCSWTATAQQNLREVDKALVRVADGDRFMQMSVYCQFFSDVRYSRKAADGAIAAGFPDMKALFGAKVICP